MILIIDPLTITTQCFLWISLIFTPKTDGTPRCIEDLALKRSLDSWIWEMRLA
jgi:hypothetical protein